MKYLTLSLLITLASCSSVKLTEDQQKVRDHMAQGKIYTGGEFSSKFQDSDTGASLVKVGIATYPAGTNDSLIKSHAIADGKFKLTEGAPAFFKSMVQRVIGSSLGNEGDFSQVDVSVSEVKALTGIQSRSQDIECKTVMEPTVELGYNTVKECRALVSVSKANLRKAYDFTISQKYGIKEKSEIDKLLALEMK